MDNIYDSYGLGIGNMKEDMEMQKENMKEDMKRQQEEMQRSMQRQMDSFRQDVDDRQKIGKQLHYINGFLDDRDDKGILVGKEGTFYTRSKLIPQTLISYAEPAIYSDRAIGHRCRPYRSIYLVVVSDIPEDTMGKAEYIAETPEQAIEIGRFLASLGRDFEVTGSVITLFGKNEENLRDIEEFVNAQKTKKVQEKVNEEIPYLADFIDPNTEIF